MKIMKKIVSILFVACTILCGSMTIHAEESANVLVSYTPGEGSLAVFQLKVKIQGNGKVLDSDKVVKNQTIYELQADEQKVFEIVPDKGYEVKSIRYDGVEIRQYMSGRKLLIKGKDHDTTLEIIIDKKPVKDDIGSVTTGDMTQRTEIILMMLVAAMAAIFIGRRKQLDRDRRNADD